MRFTQGATSPTKNRKFGGSILMTNYSVYHRDLQVSRAFLYAINCVIILVAYARYDGIDDNV